MAKSRKPNAASELGPLIATGPDALADAELLQLISELADAGLDHRTELALDRAWALREVLLARSISGAHRSRTHYCRANIWSTRRHMSSDQQSWVWKSETIDGELLELRRALSDSGFAALGQFERAQLYTNLGNILNHIGRFVEAIGAWDRAIAIIPNFAMALGNRGIGLRHYATALYDYGHTSVLLLDAARSLDAACTNGAVWNGVGYKAAKQFFAGARGQIAERIDLAAVAGGIDLNGHSLGRSKVERAYRRWCLNNRLFLNPLNDIGGYPIAGRDVLTLPSLVVGLEDGPGPPAVIHYYNTLKQEFCAARFALYEGKEAAGVHFSDRGVMLYNTLDYAINRFDLEQRTLRLLKLARAGLIYLSLGVHAEERRRAKNRAPGLIGSMPLDVLRDEWKRAF